MASYTTETTTDGMGNPYQVRVPTAITTDSLKPVEPVKTVTPKQPDITGLANTTLGVTDSIINEYNTLNQKLATAQKGQETSGQSIVDLMETLTGKTADTQAAQREAGVDTETANLNRYAEQLAGLNAQATSLNREAQAIPLQIQQQFANTGATDRGVAPIEAGRLRENALRALSIAQQSDIAAAAATGSQLRLQAAKDKAQQTIDLKYKPMEDRLAILKEQYNLNKDVLSSIDKKRTEALNLAIKKEEQQLADKKAEEKAVQGIVIEASKNGAPQNIISKLSQAKSFEEAIRIGGQYMADPLDRSIKAAQLRKLNAEVGKLNKEQQDAVVNSVVNEKDPTKLISTFFRSNPKLKTNQDINNAAAVVSSINEFAGTVGGGKITGYGFLGGGFKPEAFSSQDAIRNRAKISAVEGKLQQWLSGAALSKAQEKLVRKMVPERNDTDATIRTKLNQLTNYMLGDIKGRASAQGGQFEYIPVDLFSPDSVEPTLSSSVTQAVASGYQPQEVIDFVSQNYPDQAVKIRQAQDAGYSPEEIIEYLSLQ